MPGILILMRAPLRNEHFSTPAGAFAQLNMHLVRHAPRPAQENLRAAQERGEARWQPNPEAQHAAIVAPMRVSGSATAAIRLPAPAFGDRHFRRALAVMASIPRRIALLDAVTAECRISVVGCAHLGGLLAWMFLKSGASAQAGADDENGGKQMAAHLAPF